MSKILICSHTGVWRGGAERSLTHLAIQAKKEGHSIIVNIPDGYYELSRKLKENDINFIHHLKDRNKQSLSNLSLSSKIGKVFKRIKYIFKLYRFIKAGTYDAVYLNTIRTTSELIACKLAGVRTIMQLRGFDTRTGFRYKLLGYNNKIIVLNESSKEYLKKKIHYKHHNKIISIPNGVVVNEVAVKQEFGMSSRFINVGGYEYRKGTDYLLAIVEKLLSNNVTFTHVGEKIAKDEVSERTLQEYNELLDDDKYIELDYCENVTEVMSRMNFFIITSRVEGMPRSLLEAMERGLVVFASDIDVHKDVIEDGVNGFILNMGDIVGSVNKIKKIIVDQELCLKVSDQARRDVLNYYNLGKVNAKIIGHLLESGNEKNNYIS